MLFLLAQLVAPPLQNSPVRLPGPEAGQQRPPTGGSTSPVPVDIQPEASPPVEAPSPGPPAAPPASVAPVPGSSSAPIPAIKGLSLYSQTERQKLLAPCSAIDDPGERLKACAAALSARLVLDGYVNSRVYVQSTPAPGYLDVVEGRVVEVRVTGKDPALNRRVQRLLKPLRGEVLNLPRVEQQLQLLKRLPGLDKVRGNLSRLASDPSQAVLSVGVERGFQPWQGEFSLRNEGSSGSGEARAVATLVKSDLIRANDTLLLYSEIGADDQSSLGASISSISYTYPFSDQLKLTGAFGYSRRNLIELPEPLNQLSISQYQGLGQLEWTFRESLNQRWALFAGLSGNRGNTYLGGRALSSIFMSETETVSAPQNAYLRLGVSGSGISKAIAWGGNAYLLQGIAAATPVNQRRELASVGIQPGEATAIGALVSAAWWFSPRWQLNVRAGGQVAFEPLTSPMQFSLGSDVGLRGLPGQLISGDSGWLGTAEVVWTVWQKNNRALQIVPFIGAGGISTSLPSASFSDTVGAGGILGRWLQGNHWSLELGWVEQFETSNNLGPWQDWLLGKGLYGRLNYRF